MNALGLTFLGLIALSSLLQAGLIAYLVWAGSRVTRRLDDLQTRIDREIQPALEGLTRVTRNVAEISDIATLQARRIDELLADTVEKIEETTSLVRRIVLRPLGPLVDIVAFLKGVRRGLEAYHQLRGLETQGRGGARRYGDVDDEHLFI